SAAQLVPILRPMIPQYGHLAAYPSSNILIISDRAGNVNRMMRIIRRIDQVANQDPEIVPLQNASASEIVRVVNSFYQGAAATEGVAVKVVADERSNSVLIGGDQAQRLRIRALIAHLDTPLEAGGDTRVRYLHYANAEKIAPKLKEQITGITQAAPGATGTGAQASPLAQAEKNAMVWADPTTNALVCTAPPRIMRAVMDIVDKLDIRRPQVLVEAIIAEVDVDKSAELGINWAAFSKGDNVPAGSFVSPVGGTSIVDLAGAIQSPANASTALLQGTTIGIGRIAGTGVNFAAMVRAIRGDTITNTVLIEDGGVVVLGGLIEDNSVKGEQRVPYLGNIPLIGLLFKTRNATSTKNNLILFIRPKILRDPAQAAFETDLKYNYMM